MKCYNGDTYQSFQLFNNVYFQRGYFILIDKRQSFCSYHKSICVIKIWYMYDVKCCDVSGCFHG